MIVHLQPEDLLLKTRRHVAGGCARCVTACAQESAVAEAGMRVDTSSLCVDGINALVDDIEKQSCLVGGAFAHLRGGFAHRRAPVAVERPARARPGTRRRRKRASSRAV